ncbi:MAG: caspase family protein [Proteobacteria bacterium]|nr:caspase family protein [Pseudomonadota bacterium]
MKKLLSGLGVLVFALATVLFVSPALAERRVALVIGNSEYKDPSIVLTNPKNDANDIAKTLASLGFEVVKLTDGSKSQIDATLEQFARLATNADAALFFYAGHALQYQGRNYLMPIDAHLEDEVSIRYALTALDDVRAALDRASGVKIMILDACRNNPLSDQFSRRMAGMSRSAMTTRGLARIDKTQGMVIAYSTAADDVAIDGRGRNSPYTAALLKRLGDPGLEIEIMFRRVAAEVSAETNGKQRPETYVSLLSEYYLNQTDRIAWEKVRKDDINAVKDFIAHFPNSTYASKAREILDEHLRQEIAKQEEADRMRRLTPPASATAATPPPNVAATARPEPTPVIPAPAVLAPPTKITSIESKPDLHDSMPPAPSGATPVLSPSKPVEVKPAETKPVETKPVETKSAVLPPQSMPVQAAPSAPPPAAVAAITPEPPAPAIALPPVKSIPAPVVTRPPPPSKTKSASTANSRKRGSAECAKIMERAQLGELSEDDRAILQQDCR